MKFYSQAVLSGRSLSVLNIEVSLFQGGWNRGVHRCPHFWWLGFPVYRGVLISGGWNKGVQSCPHFRELE